MGIYNLAVILNVGNSVVNTAKGFLEKQILSGLSISSLGIVLMVFLIVSKIIKKAVGIAIICGILIACYFYLTVKGVL